MHPPKRTKQNGFTIVELLVALTIMAMLMAAVGFAFDASVKNYHANQGIYKTTNTARQALLRITNDLRNAQAVQLIGTGANEDPLDLSQCSIILSDGSDITYRFNSVDNTLYYDNNATGANYVLCNNVTAMTFNRSTVPDDSSAIRSVRIVMTLTDDLGEVNQTLATGSVVRKNL
ncbi:MAG: prepilin-type N-terminal cleavage/methylation domain-containing protein [Phycisphaerae bacterium]|nr:prepilin-type N-terminal cleavage/methylation domain-containing protein [Phycisphaerae bacterium]